MLDELQETLNNREIAVLFWVFFSFLLCMFHQNIRSSIIKLFKTCFSKYILVFFSSMGLYIYLISILLKVINFWNENSPKGILIWTLFSGVTLAFNSVINLKDRAVLKKTIFGCLTVTTFIEFVTSLYSTELRLEMMMVPFIFVISAAGVSAKYQLKDEKIESVINYLIAIIGFSLFFYSSYQFFINPLEACTLFYDFILAPILTILFIPFIYFWITYALYESIFVRLQVHLSKEVKRAAKRTIFSLCLFNLKKLQLLNYDFSVALTQLRSKNDVELLKKRFEEASR